MNEELNSMEIAAINLVDVPDAPWLCECDCAPCQADEGRHAIAFRPSWKKRVVAGWAHVP